MAAEQNKALLQRYIEEVWDKENPATIAQLFGGFFGPLLPSLDMVYGVYTLGILATFVWCLLFGFTLLQRKDG